MLPLASTPPLIEMSCCSGDGLVIVIVTLPALAVSVLVLNLSCCASAWSASCVPPPPPDAAGVEELELEELLLLEPPQPASASRAVAPKIVSLFMRRSLTGCGDQELQQRLLRVQPVLGLIPDRG